MYIISTFAADAKFQAPKRSPGFFSSQDQYVGRQCKVYGTENRELGMVHIKHQDGVTWFWPDFCIGVEYEIEVIPDEIDLLWNKQL